MRFALPCLRAWGAAAVVATATLQAACTKPNPLYCESDRDCDSDDQLPYCNTAFRECSASPGGDASPPVMCEIDSECENPDTPICDDERMECRGCQPASAEEESAECLERFGDTTPWCGESGRCGVCASNSQCGEASAPTCDQQTLSCRACVVDDDCTGDARGERCDDGGACVECTAHDQCASGVCDPAGNTCAEADAIIHVNGDAGSDSVSCGSAPSAAACRTIQKGIDNATTSHRFVLVAGGNPFPENLTVAKNLSLIGSNSDVAGLGMTKPVVRISGGAEVTIDGMVLRSSIDSHGVHCDGGGAVRLQDVVIKANKLNGVFADGCDLVIERSLVTENDGYGVEIDEGVLVVARSTVSLNDNGGVFVRDSDFQLTNVFIVRNGTGAQGTVSGIRIANFVPKDQQHIDFTTVAGNTASSSAAASGIDCEALGTPTFRGNIVVGNLGNKPAIVGDGCRHTYSLFETAQTGAGNVVGTAPETFVDVDDFHILETAPARDKGPLIDGITTDFDGQLRDAMPDMGADEYVPE